MFCSHTEEKTLMCLSEKCLGDGGTDLEGNRVLECPRGTDSLHTFTKHITLDTFKQFFSLSHWWLCLFVKTVSLTPTDPEDGI